MCVCVCVKTMKMQFCIWSSEGLQQLHEPSDIDYVENPAALSESFSDILDLTIEASKKATLLGKPRR